MARYIDVDALIELLKNPPLQHSLVKITMDDVIAMVDEQPTAYDVDAVVAELEKDTTCRFRLDGYIPKSKAINIVRNAGKDGAE